MKNISKNLISLSVIISILIVPFFDAKKANAQIETGSTITTGGSVTTGSNQSTGSSVSSYIDSLSPVIKQLPGCVGALKKGISSLFKGKSGGEKEGTEISELITAGKKRFHLISNICPNLYCLLTLGRLICI